MKPLILIIYIFIQNNEPIEVELFSIIGKKILVKNMSITEDKLDLSSLADGVYILRISNGSKFVSKKILKY